jgi:alpha-beta hydrolase superfamily lysophospholipase
MRSLPKKIAYSAIAIFMIFNAICAFHAYHLTHFYVDAAPVKKPEQMSFGEKMKAIMVGVTYPKSKTIDSLSIPHDTVLIHTGDKLTLEAWQSKRKMGDTMSSKGVVALFHGHGGSKSGVIKEAQSFYALGYDVLLVDFRAHGNSDGTSCTIGYEESQDISAAYKYVEANYQQKPIILWGISMGGAAIIKAVHDDTTLKPAKIIVEMPFGTLSQAVEGRVKMMGLPKQPISTLLTFWGGIEHGFWGFGFKPSNYAKQVHCPTLLQWGLHDARVSLEETDVIFNNLGTNKKTKVVYDNSRHQSLCANEHEKWLANVTSFLSQ